VTALLPGTERALLHDLATVQADDRQPSLVGGVVRDGALVWSAGRGDLGDPAGDPADLQYRIGSLTKTMTAVLVLQCRDDGLLGLDDQVGSHLPGSPFPATTVRQLLAHAGGVPAEPEGPWWERHEGGDLDDLVSRLSGQPRVLSPGAQHHYSNVGYALLGAVVARLRGGTWWEVLAERVLTPLGMRRTTYLPQLPHAQGWSVHPWSGRLDAEPHTDTGAMAPAGQLWSTVGDLARWAAFLLDPHPAVLAPQTLEQMRVPTASRPGDAAGSYGLGLRVEHVGGRWRHGHGGSMPGFLAGILVDPAERAGAVTLANATTGGTPPLTTTLLDTLRETEPTLPTPWTEEPELPGADDVLGAWFWGNTPLTVAVRRGVLWVDPDQPGRASRFVPDGPDRWRGLDAYFTGETLRVVRDRDGGIDRLDLATYPLRRAPYA